MAKLKTTDDRLRRRLAELEEKARLGEKAELALRVSEKRNMDFVKKIDAMVREIYAIRSMVNMPQLYLDDDWNIVGYSGDFPLLTYNVVECARQRKSIRELFNEKDFDKIRKNLEKIRALEDLPYDRGREWELRYKGPNLSEKFGEDWIIYNEPEPGRWEIVNRRGRPAIIHNPHLRDSSDCCVMTAKEYGGPDEDFKMVYRVKTSADKNGIRDLTAFISATSGREAVIPDVVGYTVCAGSSDNSVGRIQRQGVDVISRPEELEPDTEYEITVERAGGKVSRGMRNLDTGEELPPLDFIDYNAVYDRQNHIGFYTFSGAAEFFDIEIYTRKSLFSIDTFRIPIDIEVGLREEGLEGRIFNIKYAKSRIMGKALHTLMLEDVTRRRKDEEALRESEEKYRRLFEESRDAINITTQDGRIIDANPEWHNLFGYSKEDLKVMNAAQQYRNPEKREKYKKLIEKHGYVRDYEVELMRKDGTMMNCLVTSSLRRDKEGNITGYQSSVHDITERKRIEAQLEAAQRMEVIGRLASGVAHEVRNPLNGILAITEALFQDFGDNPEYRPYLDHIRTQVDRLSILMRDLLELGKPLQKNTFVPNSISQICAGAVKLWQQSSAYPDRSVRLVLPGRVDGLEVTGDEAKLKQVIFNLLDNAAQHSPAESEITVTLTGHDKKSVKICVRDQGTGMKPEIMSEVFKPFFSTRTRGAGLGLSIVKSIVETHGGDIGLLNNEPPPGLTVEIHLPLAGKKNK